MKSYKYSVGECLSLLKSVVTMPWHNYSPLEVGLPVSWMAKKKAIQQVGQKRRDGEMEKGRWNWFPSFNHSKTKPEEGDKI